MRAPATARRFGSYSSEREDLRPLCVFAIGDGSNRVCREENVMADHVYKVVELIGSSETSHAVTIQNAISRAGSTLRNLRWFEAT